MAEKLCAMGLRVEWEMVLAQAGDGSIGRPHIAQVLVDKGYTSSVQEAFTRYLGRNGPAYVEREKTTPVEAVELITSVNGLPVLAHPGDVADIEILLGEMKESGLVGMEVHYGQYPQDTMRRLAELAKRFDLIPCGGSDYHGEGLAARADLGSVDVPVESVEKLLAIAGNRVGGITQA
jgi:hypothetical protein